MHTEESDKAQEDEDNKNKEVRWQLVFFKSTLIL